MRFFIKEWPDDTVTLLTDAGQVVWIFDSVPSAIRGAREWAGNSDREPVATSERRKPPLDVAA